MNGVNQPRLGLRYPKVKVQEDRIFVIDGSIWTSAGMAATIDLVLAMVERDIGSELARAVAKKMVIHHQRSGGQSQFSALLQLESKSDRIQTALAFARKNLHTKLTVEKLAETAHLSPRQFRRTFAAETGELPAKAIENLRLEAARLMLEDSCHPLEIIARQTGFADRERMRRAFVRVFGQPPQAMRRQVRRSRQLGRDLPSGSLRTFRDADLMVSRGRYLPRQRPSADWLSIIPVNAAAFLKSNYGQELVRSRA